MELIVLVLDNLGLGTPVADHLSRNVLDRGSGSSCGLWIVDLDRVVSFFGLWMVDRD